eukprot:3995475-Alexandrium_andersonii.AAC.1
MGQAMLRRSRLVLKRAVPWPIATRASRGGERPQSWEGRCYACNAAQAFSEKPIALARGWSRIWCAGCAAH